MDFENETQLDYEEEPQFIIDENKSAQSNFIGSSKKPNKNSSGCDDDQFLQIDYLEEDENLSYSNVSSGIAFRNLNCSQKEVSSAINPLPNSTVQNHMPISFVTPIRQVSSGQESFKFLNSPSVQQFQSGALSFLNKKFQQLQPFSSPNLNFSQDEQDFFSNSQSQASDSSNIHYNSDFEVRKSQGDTFPSRSSLNVKKNFSHSSDFSKLKKYKKINFNKDINSTKGSSSFKANEKELIRLKREARLIRFGNENSFQRSKTECKTYDNLYFEDEYFLKMEEQKRKRQRIFELKEKQRHIQYPKNVGDKLINFNTGEHSLLKKTSAFYVESGMPHILDTKIKQEVKFSDERESENHFLKEGLYIIKCDFDSNVRFTRTISKTYEEMYLSKCSNKETTNTEATSISIQAKEETHINGCIVKVLNLPQATISDVLALCSPVGKPVEVKLNDVKEGAVIIKFANPILAANFYGLYHGVKVNSEFLNIVIV